MSRSKKLFTLFAVAFAVMLAYLSYDISRRTTFPGSKPQLNERLKSIVNPSDTNSMDSIKTRTK